MTKPVAFYARSAGRINGFLLLMLLAGCSSPTAPSPAVMTPPVITTPPVVVTPPPVVTPVVLPAFPPADPRFNLTFYRQFVHNAYQSPDRLDVLWRQQQAPRIYLRTIHANGSAIDTMTLDRTSAALESVAGSLTGVFGLAGIERGTGTRAGQSGWITVSWLDDPERRFCGRAAIAGDWIDLYTNTPGCRCVGGPVIAPVIVKHELGHALGFRHTGERTDLMQAGAHSLCADVQPSSREVFHAALAYTRPMWSPAP